MTAKVSWRKQGVMILAVLCVLAGLSLLCPALGGTVRAQESAAQLVLYMEDGKIIFDKDNHFYQGDRSEEVGGREVIIRQHDPSVPTGNIINIYGNEISDLSITLDGVNIDSRLSKSIMPNSKQPALYINTRSTEGNRDIEITLAPGSDNTLVSDGSIRSNSKIPGYGAMHVGGHDSDNGTSRVTIKSDPSKPGRLNATNYGDAAGINYGTNNDTLGKYPDLGDLVIEGGIITAQGGPGNVGIGCSHADPYIDPIDEQYKCWTGGGTLQVTGGTVTAIGGEGAVGIGVPVADPPRQFSIQIDGGSVHAEGVRPTSVTPTNKDKVPVFQNEVTVAGADSANVAVTGGIIRDSADMVPLDYGLESVYIDEHSRLWFYLPANDPTQRDKSVMEIADLAVDAQTGLKGSWWVNDPDAPEEIVSGENRVQVAARYADNDYAFKPGGNNAVVYTQDISKPMAPAFVTADTHEPVEPAASYYKDADGNWSAVNGNSAPATSYQIAVLEPAAEGFAQKTATQPYEIQKVRPLTATAATVGEKIYDGTNVATVTGEVAFDGLDSGDTLERDKDYTVTAAFVEPEARKDKDVTVNVTLLDTEKTARYIMADGGKLMTKATIAPRSLSDAAVTVGPIPDETYTGNPIIPEVAARFEGAEGSVPLKKDTDYTAVGQNNTGAGTAKLILTGKGNYTGTREVSFSITKAEITGVSFEDVTVPYDGKSHEITLKGELPKGASVTYENNKGTEAGTYNATAKISGGANYQDKTLNATLTIKAPNPYVPVKPTNPGEAAADIDKLPDAQDYDKLPPEQQELVKEAVKTVAQGIAGLPSEQQAQIPADKIEKLGELYDRAYKVTIYKDTSAADGLKNYVKEEDIQIFGAGMAAQSLGSDVKISITQDPPADGAIMAFSLNLFIDQNGKYIPVELKTPIVIKFTLPDGVSGDNLVIRHLNPDGKLKELLYPEINGRELTFMTTSFSNFLFVETGKPTPTPSPTPRPTPADNSNTLKNPVTGLPMSTSEAALLGLSAIVLLTLGAVALRRHDMKK